MRFAQMDILSGKREVCTMFQIMPITDVYAREIYNVQGDFTIEVKVAAGENCLGKMQVQQGKRGMQHFINEKIARELQDVNVFAQWEVDQVISKLSEEKSLMYALSASVARCAAKGMKVPLYRYLGGVNKKTLPIPVMYLASCGKRGANQTHVREFMMIPAGAKSCGQALEICVKIYHALRKEVCGNGEIVHLDEHGGIVLNGMDEEILELLKRAAKDAGYQSGREVYYVMNCAAMENAVWVRPSRFGTVTQVMKMTEELQREGKLVIFTQETGDSEDSFLVDLSVAAGARLIKLGAPGKLENTAKYNRLLEIEESLGRSAEISCFHEH